MEKIYFITGNENKLKEVQAIMPEVEGVNLDLIEIQELDSRKVIEHKLMEAMKQKPGKNLIVEDVSFTVEGMNGLPGPLIKWFLQSVDSDGIFKMAKNFGDQKAEARATFGFANSNGEIRFFEGVVKGKIVSPRGEMGFGWDVIFIPEGYDKTYAEMRTEEKNRISHRRKALDKLKKYLEK
jgi:inosine triphosphate pyrophosphatase